MLAKEAADNFNDEYLSALNQCPLIACYLDSEKKRKDFSNWFNSVAEVERHVTERIKNDHGENWKRKLLQGPISSFEELRILKCDPTESQFREVVGLLFKFGYEMSGEKTADVLIPHIQSQLSEYGFFKSNLPESSLLGSPITRGLREAISAGILARKGAGFFSEDNSKSIVPYGERYETTPKMQLINGVPATIWNSFTDRELEL